MKKSIKPIAIGILCLLAVFQTDVCAQEAYETKPITNNGKKWRIGYLEGGSYANYQSILKAITASLMDSGWIQSAPIPECQNKNETRTLWNFLSTKIQSNYLKFPTDAYWTAEWNDAERERLKSVIINRLKTDKDIDLMLAFGTWAGQDLANNQHDTSTMVLSVSNAVQSGIIKSVEDSGFDHVHAWIDPEKTELQLRLFHEIIGFKRLGLAYQNNLDGKSYAAVEDVLKLSRELDFQVIECLMPVKPGAAHKEAELIRCHKQLAPKIDAMYITDYAGLTKNSITKLLSPLFKHQVPMFAQTRYDLVKNGILIGAARSEFSADAEFYTDTFAKILHGIKPSDLPQKFASPLKIVINCNSAIIFRTKSRKMGNTFPS